MTGCKVAVKGEEIYRDRHAGKSLTDLEWIQAMVSKPILIERPIGIRGARAAIGRPPENLAVDRRIVPRGRQAVQDSENTRSRFFPRTFSMRASPWPRAESIVASVSNRRGVLRSEANR